MKPKYLYRLGILVPSSNTTMEPLISFMVQDLNKFMPWVSIITHFSRVKVTQITSSPSADSQFALESMLSAASLLADAQVNIIGWGGTSAGWLGIDTDTEFCRAVEKQFGIPAYSSTLALFQQLKTLQLDSVGLITPYTSTLNDAITRNFAAAGVRTVTSYQPLNLTNNIEIGNVLTQDLETPILQVVTADPTLCAATTFCTNLQAAHVARRWEEKYNVWVLDSVTSLIWGLFWTLRLDPRSSYMGEKWGRIFLREPIGVRLKAAIGISKLKPWGGEPTVPNVTSVTTTEPRQFVFRR